MADTTRGARVTSAGIVLWHVTMSLDGFIAGPDDAMDWVFEHAEPNPAVDQVIRTTGAILAGRRTYNVGRRDVDKPSGQAFGGAWTGPQFVLTHDVPDGSDDPSVTFLSGDITNAVNLALTAAGGKNVLVLGANVAKQCIDAGLLDEVLVHLAPVWVTASGSSVAPGSGGWTWNRSASSESGVWRTSASASRSTGTRSRRRWS
jgi:dihydrofolate reductase